MSKKFPEYKGLDLPRINKEVLEKWKKEDTFAQSLALRKGHPPFVFYEGPPSANGMPGIHHVMARAVKDIFCRYKTLKGFLVNRRAGWDTHGLPVELGVEKMLGITKEDIGKPGKPSIDEYNAACRREVMKYTKEWENLTEQMGYWVDMKNPYVTCDNRYIETLWHLLRQLYSKNLLYKGYTIQPYSPAAGTGLSAHELNQQGCYRDVKDTACVAMFEVAARREELPFALPEGREKCYLLAWTTTPWTLPSNTALCVGADIEYTAATTCNPYSGERITVILAKDLVAKHFNPKAAALPFEGYKAGDKLVPYRVVGACSGAALEGIPYRQLIPWVNPGSGAFRVITGDFVTTEDGTGIVHIAPTFGADDDRVARLHGIPPLMLVDKSGARQPMVDRTGKFFRLSDLDETFVKENVNRELYGEYAGRFVKNAYDPDLTESDPSLDVDLCVMLKQQGLAFKIEKHVHSYPHCWRTDKPVLYYPLDSWFIKTTACKERMVALNKTIGWKPESTGTGRFGKWLEELKDWNLSRSRYWGTPLPIWRSEDGSEEKCIGSVAELYGEIEKAVAAGVMSKNPYREKGFVPERYTKENYDRIDLHRPYVDEIVLASGSGTPMKREPDLVDVWFDSGAMPFAQDHYPFEGREEEKVADFIAEGVDQTRGWFFTLHAIAVMVADSVAFRNVVANGLVLDKNGNKMSKRLGNAVEPFGVMENFGADALRWYMVANAQPWDNLKFDVDGIDEVRRKFFGTLYNTYSFFALYANVDRFTGAEAPVEVSKRPEVDRWIISLLNTLVRDVESAYEAYEPTLAGRLIQEFVCDHLSNWYVRLNRKRFWGGSMTQDKLAAYQTLLECLRKVVILASPIAPFITDKIFCDLCCASEQATTCTSVHLADFPAWSAALIDAELEKKMQLAQQATSMILALRRKVNIRVRQPLQRAVLAVANPEVEKLLTPQIKEIVRTETNVKDLQVEMEVVTKRAKANFKTLGAKCGKSMKEVAAQIQAWKNDDVTALESCGEAEVTLASGEKIALLTQDVEIITESIPGYECLTEGKLTLALDVTVTDALRQEGIARELVNRIQNLRKDSGFEVTDRITVQVERRSEVEAAVATFAEYIKGQVLATSLSMTEELSNATAVEIDDYTVKIRLAVVLFIPPTEN
ncbi:MAG: isoleucine--tRNA ligase [Prevotellaceae bacterium]|jgi:isoleucyl-tRNA synthetase|nr:isoleucine--tRNA ligase [Prevotellaceae bacterium]